MKFDKITAEDRAGKGNVGQPDTPNLSTSAMQVLLDSLPNLAIDKHNEFIDALNAAFRTVITRESTDNQIPTSKAVYDFLNNVVLHGEVASFNGRTGMVYPQAGDYSADQVTYGEGTVKSALDYINRYSDARVVGKTLCLPANVATVVGKTLVLR